VVLVVRLARASAGFGVEAARPNIDEVHAGQNAAAQIVGIAVAVYGSGVREGVVGVVRAVAVFKECAQGQAARRKVDSPGQAGKQGKAVHVQMRAGVVAQRTAGQRAEPGKAVPFRVVRTGGGPYGGIHAPARHEVEDKAGPVVAEVLHYINEHYPDELSLDLLSAKFFISKYHLSHEFHRLVGTSVYRYIIQKRLVIAKQMLANGVAPTDVYGHCGFGDYANFYRAFKAEYHISPKQFLGRAGNENTFGG
ncbi:MAG: AraC family transcriptional regulator, partial [Ruthenibacterium lactatiformans]|nr:AraC family transcriptional regulator [Ruthenibacterium lactatiformans]